MRINEIKDYIIMGCVGYTVASMICTILCYVPGTRVSIKDPVIYIQLFVCTVLICVFQYLAEYLPVKSQAGMTMISICINVAATFVMGGGVFKWFGWSVKNVILVAAIAVAAFLITYRIMILHYRELARAINKKIADKDRCA